MNTRDLARMLDAIRIARPNERICGYSRRQRQPFDYLLVLDFEATCWEMSAKDKGYPEIIEFPVVLYDDRNNAIIAEFHQYITPSERPILSSFCTELTGISQQRVDKGIPLEKCLVLFEAWINDIQRIYNMEFPYISSSGKKKCVFSTWSDWDLGTCLRNECKRKRLENNVIFSKWIDIKKIYLNFYRRSCQGLNGAIMDVGLRFEGRQHSGRDDARNTARLVGKMIEDGVILQLTKF